MLQMREIDTVREVAEREVNISKSARYSLSAAKLQLMVLADAR